MSQRELDAWLAEHLFGWASVAARPPTPIDNWTRLSGLAPGDISGAYAVARGYGGDDVPFYSSTGLGMLAVIEAMRGRTEAEREAFNSYFTYRQIEVIGIAPLAVALAAKAALESAGVGKPGQA